jgi:DNA-binding HxlR family transcriptional regulator
MTALTVYQESPDPNLENYFRSIGFYFSEVVAILSDGKVYRFNEIKRKLRKLSSNTLSSVLKRLVSEGIVNRLVIPSSPPRTEYSLTQKGIELSSIIADYTDWLRRWHEASSEYP